MLSCVLWNKWKCVWQIRRNSRKTIPENLAPTISEIHCYWKHHRNEIIQMKGGRQTVGVKRSALAPFIPEWLSVQPINANSEMKIWKRNIVLAVIRLHFFWLKKIFKYCAHTIFEMTPNCHFSRRLQLHVFKPLSSARTFCNPTTSLKSNVHFRRLHTIDFSRLHSRSSFEKHVNSIRSVGFERFLFVFLYIRVHRVPVHAISLFRSSAVSDSSSGSQDSFFLLFFPFPTYLLSISIFFSFQPNTL